MEKIDKVIDLETVLQHYPELRTMRFVDVQTLVEMSDYLTRVPIADRRPLGPDRRDRCTCQMFMAILRRSELSLRYPGMPRSPMLSARDELPDAPTEMAYLECRRCGYRYVVCEAFGLGYKPMPDGKDRVIRVRKRER